jgi:hypothetical protein
VLKDDRLAELLDTILAATAQASAPSTALRAVPLPRFAEEEPEPAARSRTRS